MCIRDRCNGVDLYSVHINPQTLSYIYIDVYFLWLYIYVCRYESLSKSTEWWHKIAWMKLIAIAQNVIDFVQWSLSHSHFILECAYCFYAPTYNVFYKLNWQGCGCLKTHWSDQFQSIWLGLELTMFCLILIEDDGCLLYTSRCV